MRFLPLSLPSILGYVASALLVGAPENHNTESPHAAAPSHRVSATPLEQNDLVTALTSQLPNSTATCQVAEGAFIAATPVVGFVQNGALAQFMVLMMQIVSGTVAALRPRFFDIPDGELLAGALNGFATR